MKRLFLLAILVATGWVGGCRDLWFEDFEGDVKVLAPYVDGGQWWSKLGGEDWDPLPGVDHGFQAQVADEKNVREFVLEDVIRIGNNQVLYQAVLADDPDFQGNSRSNYFFTPDSTKNEFYQSMRIFLQPDLLEVMSSSDGGFTYNWRQMWEEKSCDDPPGINRFRIGVGMAWNPSHGLFWDIGAEQDEEIPAWSYRNYEVPVPIGRWFELHIYLRQHQKDGRFIATADGKVLADHVGQTMVEGCGVEKWKLVSLYTDPYKSEGAVHWQRVDNVRFWCR